MTALSQDKSNIWLSIIEYYLATIPSNYLRSNSRHAMLRLHERAISIYHRPAY